MTPERWQQIERLYHAALGRPEAEREAWLRQACAGDEELRGGVESMLAHEASAQAFFAAPPPGLANLRAASHAMFEPGATLGSYRIVRPLGRGGMGVVFEAYDTTLHRTVALKVIAEASDEASRAQVLREARSAAALNHPNVCIIYEIGDAGGSAYIAMEYVEGSTLRDRLEERALRPAEVAGYGIQAAGALAYAHDHGVIHRDLKAENAIVTEAGRLKLVDFGLARRVDAIASSSGTTAGSLFAAGVVAGTPYAMAPEQVLGGTTDARTDVWALGVLLYEMACGSKPFDAPTITEVFASILRDALPPLPDTVPLPLRAVIERCLNKDPDERYQHASDIAVALAEMQEGAASGVVQQQDPVRRRRRVLAASLAAAAAILAIGIATPLGDRLWGGSADAAFRIAVLPLVNLTRDPDQEYLSDGLTDALISDLASVGTLQVISRASVMRYKGSDAPRKSIASALNVNAIVEGSAERLGDSVRMTVHLTDAETGDVLWENAYDRRIADVRRVSGEIAGTIARRVNATLTPRQAHRLSTAREVNPEVYEAYLRGMFYLSQEAGTEKGLAFLHRAVQIDPADPLAWAGLAEGYVTIGHSPSPPPPETFPRARAAAEQALKLDPDMAEAVGALADVALYYEWDWEKAERLFARSMELNPSLAMTHYHYAWYLALVDRMNDAITAHQLARDLDPLRPLHTGWLAGLYQIAGRPDDAIAEARKALELSPGFAPSYHVMFLALSQKGMADDALQAAQAVVGSPSRYAGPLLLATALAKAGRREEALAAFAGAKENNPWLATQFYLALGDKDEAINQLEAAYRVRMPVLPWVRVPNFGFDELHDDPRFRDLVRRMRLPL
jgi:TolB-like protein/Tfp pilus assembly protein PilF/predicted Ser/Thr protein kinase